MKVYTCPVLKIARPFNEKGRNESGLFLGSWSHALRIRNEA